MRSLHVSCRCFAASLVLIGWATMLHAQPRQTLSVRKMSEEMLKNRPPQDVEARSTRVLTLTEPRKWTYTPKDLRDRTHRGAYRSQENRNSEVWVFFEDKLGVPLRYLSEADKKVIAELDELTPKIKRDYGAMKQAQAQDVADVIAASKQNIAEIAARNQQEFFEWHDALSAGKLNSTPRENPDIAPDGNQSADDADEQAALEEERNAEYVRIPIVAGNAFTPDLLEYLKIGPDEVIDAVDGRPYASVNEFHTRFMEGPPISFTLRDPTTGAKRVVPVQAPPESDEDRRLDAQDESLGQPIDRYELTEEEKLEEADYEKLEKNANIELQVVEAVPTSAAMPIASSSRPRQQPQTLPIAEWDVAPFIAFVGGAGDYSGVATSSARGEVKAPMAFFGMYDHRNIRDGLFEIVRTDARYNTVPRTLKYYGHYRRDSIVRDVKAHVRQYGKKYRTPIVLVGHSYGGNTVWNATSDLSASAWSVDLLVTLDAVATIKHGAFLGNPLISGNPAKRWLNVFCTNNWDSLGAIGDNFFDIAGRYGRKRAATRNIRVSDKHTDTLQMYEHVERDVLSVIQPDKSVVLVNLTNKSIAVATLAYQHYNGNITGKLLTGCTLISPGESLHVSRHQMYAIYGASGPLSWPQAEQAVLPIRLQTDSMNETIALGTDDAWAASHAGLGWSSARFYKLTPGIHRISEGGGRIAYSLENFDVPISYYSRKRKSFPAPRKSMAYPLNPPAEGNLVHFQFQHKESKNSPVYQFWQTGNQVEAYGRTEGFKIKGFWNTFHLGGREKCYVYGTLKCFYTIPTVGVGGGFGGGGGSF